MALSLPSQINITDLQKVHPSYHAMEYEDHYNLYSGNVKKNIDRYIYKQDLERSNVPNANIRWENRKTKAKYINRAAALCDFMVASTCVEDPKIVADSDYWQGLNSDATGTGADLPQVVREALLYLFLYQRAYFTILPPSDVAIPSQPATLEMRMGCLSGQHVDDWELDEFGNMVWCRVHVVSTARSTAYLPQAETVHTWTFFEKDKTTTYQAKQSDTVATKVSEEPNDLGFLTIVPIVGGDQLYTMKRLFEPLIALWNRETSITCLLDEIAFPQKVLTLATTKVADILNPQVASLILKTEQGITETFAYASPSSVGSDMLFKDVERLKSSLHEVLHTLSLAGAAATQNARQAATAKELDREPMRVLLRSFTWPLIDALEIWVDRVKVIRSEEELTVKVTGLSAQAITASMEDVSKVLDNVETDSTEAKPAEAQTALAEAGQVQETALNGAQVTSMQEIVQAVALKQMPAEAAKQILYAAFPTVSKEMVDKMIDSAAGFEVKPVSKE